VNHVQDAVQPTHAPIAFAYCDYKNLRTHCELELVASIARQLVEQAISIPATVLQFCDRNAKTRRNATADEWIALIESICLSFSDNLPFYGRYGNIAHSGWTWS
jgi:hypothetical protein